MFSGAYGIVLNLDPSTVAKAKSLTEGLEADFKSENIHLTLFHTKLKDAPLEAIRDIVGRCDEALRGRTLSFENIATFGDNFLFWDSSKDPAVLKAHQIALELTDYLERTDLSGHTKGEQLTLSPEQSENIRLYGHPLVRGLYRPHITLAYHSKGFPDGSFPTSVRHEARIEGAMFAEIGQFGRVLKEVKLDRGNETREHAEASFGKIR